jgi:hypothetical protein
MISKYPIPLNILSFVHNPNNNTLNIPNFKHKVSGFVSFVLTTSLINTKKRDGDVAISYRWMSRFIGKELKKVLDLLIENGFLIKTRTYYAGSHSNCYKLNKEKCGEFKFFDLHYFGLPKGMKKTPYERILEYFAEKRADTLKEIGKLADAVEYIKELTYDKGDIEVELQRMEAEDAKIINTKKERFRGAKNRLAWNNFESKSIFASQSEVGGRYYTSFCNLSNDLKKHLSYKGKPIFNVDIKCAQPLILSHLYDEMDEDTEFVEQERKAYLEAVNDDIYTLIGAEGKARGKIKKDFYNIFFGRLGKWNKELFKNFQENFPLLAQKIIQLKKENHRTLAHKLQRIESDIVVHGAYLEFLEVHDKFALTIHDSIVCLEEDIGIIKELLNKHFAKRKIKCLIEVERITVKK